ncbi:MerC domain-containing protein [Pacificimonas sp. WHA3]|uniref:MerC domain-containing protein n=1 Tax=Pacificimonas pallii TaxID=2827236 RepID=A0ABS6SEE1_9SPHN|nr:MerC domain-containing protein [Pacificimonas pallii]MBV7256775.1 MerC domain-containing protein [Pacificimonas pallii]
MIHYISAIMARRFNVYLDRFAIGLSGLCLVHCLIGALFMAFVAASGTAVLGHNVHQWGLAIAVPLAVVALVGGAVSHGRWEAVAVGSFGVGAMGGALLAGHGPREIVLTILGVILVAIAHALNMRWAHPKRG